MYVVLLVGYTQRSIPYGKVIIHVCAPHGVFYI